MKKLLVILIVLLLACGSALASDIDWESMTDEEITAAIAEAQAVLDSRTGDAGQVKEVIVPIGVWKVGEDIPVGHWSITVAPGGEMVWGIISYGTQLDELGKNIENVYGEPYYWEMIKIEGSDALPNLTTVDLDMKDGAYVVIEECDMIFTPYQGKPKLDF